MTSERDASIVTASAHPRQTAAYGLCLAGDAVGYVLGITFKLSYFNVKILTMHRWFNIRAAEQDLGYAPIVSFSDGWADTLEWFKASWLPTFDANAGLTGLSKGTEAKIATAVAGTAKN